MCREYEIVMQKVNEGMEYAEVFVVQWVVVVGSLMVRLVGLVMLRNIVFFFKQKTAYEMRISDWSSDVCSSDLFRQQHVDAHGQEDQKAQEPSRARKPR